MEKEKLELFRGKLMDLKRRLSGDYEKALDANSEEFGLEMPDMNDEATRTMNRRIFMSIGDKSLDALRKIEDALERIGSGEYGQCAECGAVIPEGRLEFLPQADMCVPCQERLEKD
jgi:DnaK suppressor protein